MDEVEKLQQQIEAAVKNQNRLEALKLTGRLNGLLMRKDPKLIENIGKFESSMKVANGAHQALLHAINNGDKREMTANAVRIRTQLLMAFAALGFLDRGENHE